MPKCYRLTSDVVQKNGPMLQQVHILIPFLTQNLRLNCLSQSHFACLIVHAFNVKYTDSEINPSTANHFCVSYLILYGRVQF